MRLMDMTWVDAKAANNKEVIIPIGSIEQHGPHLPLDTDSLLVQKIAEEVGKRTDCIVAPPILFGVSEEHMDFSGTITLSPQTFSLMVYDVCKSLHSHGFSRLHIINYHGGNKNYLRELLPKLRHEKINACLHSVLGRLGKFDHAGEGETSMMMHLSPERVHRDKITAFRYRIPVGSGWRTIDYSDSGVIGEASDANQHKGRKYFELIVESLIKEIRDEKGR